MYQDCPVKLKMKRLFLNDSLFDENVHNCKIIQYNSEEENIYLLAGKTELTMFSLDAEYECEIGTEEGEVKCVGTLIERYLSKMGKVLVFHVHNGFYKKLVNER